MVKLHPLFMVIFFFILLQFLFFQQIMPFVTSVHLVLTQLPYSKGLVYSALLLVIGHLFAVLFEEQDYDAMAELIRLSVRLTLLSFWFVQLAPVFQQLMRLFERLQ
jgi:hypothetical protein